MDKLAKVKAEAERLKEWQPIATPSLNQLLSFIDSLQEEPVSDTQPSVIFYGLTGSVGNTKNEPSIEDLEEAADCYKDMIAPEEVDDSEHAYSYETYTEYQIADAFKAGAEWQKAKDQETIELAEDHAMLAGMEKMKEQMVKDAVEGEVGYWNIRGLSLNIRLPKEFEEGDKVKVVLIKEE